MVFGEVIVCRFARLWKIRCIWRASSDACAFLLRRPVADFVRGVRKDLVNGVRFIALNIADCGSRRVSF